MNSNAAEPLHLTSALPSTELNAHAAAWIPQSEDPKRARTGTTKSKKTTRRKPKRTLKRKNAAKQRAESRKQDAESGKVVINDAAFPALGGRRAHASGTVPDATIGRPTFTREFVQAYFRSHCRNFLRAAITGKWAKLRGDKERAKDNTTASKVSAAEASATTTTNEKETGSRKLLILKREGLFANHRPNGDKAWPVSTSNGGFASGIGNVEEGEATQNPNAGEITNTEKAAYAKIQERKQIKGLFSEAKFYENIPSWYDQRDRNISPLLAKDQEMRSKSGASSGKKYEETRCQTPSAHSHTAIAVATETNEKTPTAVLVLPSPAFLLKQFQSAVMKDDPELAETVLTEAASAPGHLCAHDELSQYKNFRECLIHANFEWPASEGVLEVPSPLSRLSGIHNAHENFVTTSPLMACVIWNAHKVGALLLQQEQVDPMRRTLVKMLDRSFLHIKWSSLHLAAYLGRASMLVLLMDFLRTALSFTWKDKRDDTPLHLVAAGSSPRHTECAKALVRANLSREVILKLSQRNKKGETPAEIAAQLGHAASLAVLLKLPYCPPVTSCIALAAESGAIEALKLLISKGGSCGEEGGRRTPLALAAAHGHLECCQILVEGLLMSPSTSAFSLCVSEALCEAARAGRPSVLALLLDAVTDHGGVSLCSEMLCSFGSTNDTPIIICARSPMARLECVQKLLLVESGLTSEPQAPAPLPPPLRQPSKLPSSETINRAALRHHELRLRGHARDLLTESRTEGGAMALPLSLLQGKEGFPFANLLLRVGGVALLDHPNRKHKTPLMFLLSKLSSTKSEEQRKKIYEGLAWLLTWPETTTTELFFTSLERELFGKAGRDVRETGAKRLIRKASISENASAARWTSMAPDGAWLDKHAFHSGLSLDQVVIFVCGGDRKKLVAHRAVLVAEVDIIRSMLAAPMQEGIAGEIRLAEFSSQAVAVLLDFAYGFAIPCLDVPVLGLEGGSERRTAQVRVLVEALSLAHYLMYAQMFAPVAAQIARNLSPETVFEVLQTAGALLPETKQLDIAVRSYVLRHFQMIQERWPKQMSGDGPNCRDLAVYILTS